MLKKWRQRSVDVKTSIWDRSTSRCQHPSELPPYKYKRLQENEFRLIVLLGGKVDEVVRVEIEHADVQSEHHFAALSYVWGDAQNDLHPVIINGKSVHLATYNLWQALRRVRVEDEDRVLWVDAMCIDQKNDVEKSYQIQLMPHIYPQANRVLCWLGDDDGTISDAFSTLKQWAAAYQKDSASSALAVAARDQLQQSQDTSFASLGTLFNRPYFRRAWCMQEVCVDAEKPPILLCGQQEISWAQLYYGFFTMASTLYDDEVRQITGDNVKYVLPMLNISWSSLERLPLSYLVPKALDREATVPHDKIFSLLGISKRSGITYPPPDYSRSIEHTCMMYTRAMMEIDQRLDILALVAPGKESDGVSSWSLKPGRWRTSRSLEHFGLRDGAVAYKYCATKGSTLTFVAPSGQLDPILRIRGKSFTRIVAVHDMAHFQNKTLFDAPQTWRNILDRCSDFCKRVGLDDHHSVTSESILMAFFRTITVDNFWIVSRSYRSWLAQDRLYHAYEQHMAGIFMEGGVNLGAPKYLMTPEQLVDFMMQAFGFKGPISPVESTVSKGEIAERGIPYAFLERRAISDFLQIVLSEVGDRRFISTENGHIGLGPSSCQEGDEVALLPGLTVPLVLRESFGHIHRLVGDAYVHGIMYGEGMGGSGSSEWTEFSIA